MVNTEGINHGGWSTKRKSKMPLRSLSRPSSPSTGGRSSPTHQEAVPGVMIKFVGEMTKIDDTPTFSLRVVHEQRNGLFPIDPHNISISPSAFHSQSNNDQTPLLLKLPSHSGSRSRRTRSSRTTPMISYREEAEDSDGKPSSSDSETSIGNSLKNDDHHFEDSGRGRRKQSNTIISASDRINRKKSCSSCGTKKTPYWREGWEPSIILCNACGIRYQKYKRYCARCIAIARKDDKGRLHCPECYQRL